MCSRARVNFCLVAWQQKFILQVLRCSTLSLALTSVGAYAQVVVQQALSHAVTLLGLHTKASSKFETSDTTMHENVHLCFFLLHMWHVACWTWEQSLRMVHHCIGPGCKFMSSMIDMLSSGCSAVTYASLPVCLRLKL